jgi:methylenetetrahydrofolate reductase (NADPH)
MTFRDALSSRRFVVTTELVPPRGASAAACRDRAVELAAFADAINITDGAGAAVRMSSLAAAAIVAQAGGAPIVQITTRDRNRIALAADVLGAAALGAVGVLPLYGDPVAGGENPGAMEVRDLEPIELTRLIAALNAGVLPSGSTFEGACDLPIGAAATPGGASLAGLVAKVEAGVSFIQTQMVLDIEVLRSWLARIREEGLHERAAVIVGIAVPGSAAVAERFRTFGAAVPDEVVRRAGAGEGAAIAREIVQEVAATPGVAGVHLYPLSTPLGAIAELAALARQRAAAAR